MHPVLEMLAEELSDILSGYPIRLRSPYQSFYVPVFPARLLLFRKQVGQLNQNGTFQRPCSRVCKFLLSSGIHHKATCCPTTNDCHAYLLTTSSRAERSFAEVLDLKYDFPCVSRFLFLLCIKANFIKDYLKKNIDHFTQLLQKFSI